MDEKQREVGTSFFNMMATECALAYATGLTNSKGSPFKLLRGFYPECPRNRKKAMRWINEMLLDLGSEPRYFKAVYRTIEFKN